MYSNLDFIEKIPHIIKLSVFMILIHKIQSYFTFLRFM